MRITDIRPTTVTVPLEAPVRHANGCHWGRFVRTIIEVDTDEGITGLGEMGGGGESAEAVFRAMKNYLVGHDPARLEEMRYLIANPTASLYNNRTQILAHSSLPASTFSDRSGTCLSLKFWAGDCRTEYHSRHIYSFVIQTRRMVPVKCVPSNNSSRTHLN